MKNSKSSIPVDVHLPSRTDMLNKLSELKKTNLSKVSFEKIFIQLKNSIVFIPFIKTQLPINLPVYRSRLCDGETFFYCEQDISYRTDINSIDKFGRANVPHQSVFYGSSISENCLTPSLINLLEISKHPIESLLRHGPRFLTVGKWIVKKEFDVANVSFSNDFMKVREDIKDLFKLKLNQIKSKYPNHSDFYIDIIKFYSDEFSKKIDSYDDYKISAAYFNLIVFGNNNVFGVTYPTVKGNFETNNIALIPYAVETFLELEQAAVFKVFLNKKTIFFENYAYCENFGPLNCSFKWKYFSAIEKNVEFKF